ncbi:glycoside hydrolase family 15 protein [Paracraurococcus lichenis]|uniref:Glycoside hydrolase family 15 protein n=1 Tax=Paracraurococcus lichenis TaxID=3064888 RepID=A0ABT9E3A6_9PROT|nr:glycoside hydrolase family 15 protein [Paracraurococcus sp. LOR1-02]MDO9710646.1 glycoside hydrolase family 15 protein [Paracraurococcus sp. LOR1-02]
MTNRIEDYAVIGNRETMALVGRDGAIDWLCLPRFDSPACFAALLGGPENGRWRIAPADSAARVTRRYRDGTLVLETRFETPDGAATLIDCMRRRDGSADIVRLVRGERGRLAMRSDLAIRFDYGRDVPWVSRLPCGRLRAIAGPDRLVLDTPVRLRGEDLTTVAEFEVAAGQEVPFLLTWSPSFHPLPARADAAAVIEAEAGAWQAWSSRCAGGGEWAEAVRRSLITLRALAHHETGGIVAAATTSLPEQIGGPRNWDYRFCWLRDATLTLLALMDAGYAEEAASWREWLLRAAAGSPKNLQIMYGLAGERRLDEWEVPWLGGYEGSRPVRIGNAASGQLQLDVYGEVMDALYHGRRTGIEALEDAWNLEKALVNHLMQIWEQPDDGIWEVRGDRQHFTHSKVMAWVALDRAIRSAEEFGMRGPVAHWRAVRARIHAEVCERGFDPGLGSFVQAFGARHLDASLLMIPLVGFLPPEDPRVRGTVAAIERELLRDGFVLRYDTGSAVDGLPAGEGAFLACSFWLADNYVLLGRTAEARAMFERLLDLRNDVGLLAEEYDPALRRQVGNFPQAFSHIALVNTAHNLTSAHKPAQRRARRAGHAASGPGH